MPKPSSIFLSKPQITSRAPGISPSGFVVGGPKDARLGAISEPISARKNAENFISAVNFIKYLK